MVKTIPYSGRRKTNKDTTAQESVNKSCSLALPILPSHWRWLWPHFFKLFSKKNQLRRPTEESLENSCKMHLIKRTRGISRLSATEPSCCQLGDLWKQPGAPGGAGLWAPSPRVKSMGHIYSWRDAQRQPAETDSEPLFYRCVLWFFYQSVLRWDYRKYGRMNSVMLSSK